MMPVQFKPYFWDVDFNTLSLENNPQFVLKRLLDFGNLNAIKWVLKNFTKKDIANIILKSRDLSPKTMNFWTKYLCLNKHCSPTLPQL